MIVTQIAVIHITQSFVVHVMPVGSWLRKGGKDQLVMLKAFKCEVCTSVCFVVLSFVSWIIIPPLKSISLLYIDLEETNVVFWMSLTLGLLLSAFTSACYYSIRLLSGMKLELNLDV